MASSDTESGGQRPMLASQRKDTPSEATRTQGKAGYFPLGYKEGFSQWWAGLSPAVTEHRVLSFIPHLQKPPTHTQTGSAPASTNASTQDITKSEDRKAEPVTTSSINDPYGPRKWNSDLVELAGKSRFLNEFSVERIGEHVDNNLVMIHGYGAGLGFFYRNFESLSRLPGWKLYALDMLGMGRSSRPPFKIHAKDRQGKIEEAESWFIDALEEWRIKKGIDRFTLLGHSMGGYMAVAYALKYPGHLNKLILASPVGIPEDPYAVNADMPEPEDSTMVNEFTQDQGNSANGTNPDIPASAKTGDNNNFLNAKAKRDAANNSGKPPKKPLPKWLTTLWDANISPFSFVRWSGPLGPRLVSGWTSRRFSHLPADESQALHDYSYSLFRQRGSGEYALAYILAPGAFARSPLIRRIQGVGRQWISERHSAPTPDDTSSAPTGLSRVRETGIPVVLMYGENDWMDKDGGRAAAEKIEAEKQKALATATDEEKARENGDAKVVIIRKAGHHVYLDGADHFNSVMDEEMRDVEARDKKLGFMKK
ncbi:alpha/beta-hydrolase [Aureobasidium pullulans]|uniref:Alpha/beta-hydrolase n=1 Tax=Aureobasidium pullulans TaxID=5580 RepID=A0A4S9VT23_AURPU|nr:alpha/beta-hydrolase [Aureobasidium pullulans]THZ45718.1 alpha/beta-hydrolase [Aureobasidium pullulans]THZ55569.1 alpha/beta-hydrolase [Aureobasidium pullulans]